MKLGDAVKSITDALGIPQCGGCKKRQEMLNAMFEETWTDADQRALDGWIKIAEIHKGLNLDALYEKYMAQAQPLLDRKSRVLGK